MSNDIWVCICEREFKDEEVYSFHYTVCEIINKDHIKDVLDGKDVTALDSDDPLEMYMLNCQECNPEGIQEMINAAASCILNPSDDTSTNFISVLDKLEAHAKTHELTGQTY